MSVAVSGHSLLYNLENVWRSCVVRDRGGGGDQSQAQDSSRGTPTTGSILQTWSGDSSGKMMSSIVMEVLTLTSRLEDVRTAMSTYG